MAASRAAASKGTARKAPAKRANRPTKQGKAGSSTGNSTARGGSAAKRVSGKKARKRP